LKNITDKQNAWLVVVNPASGGGKVFRRFADIEKAFAAHGIPYEVRLTQKAGDAVDIVKNGILTEGYRHIMGIGGDGTGNEIINGIFSQKTVPISDIVYTMYAGGTGNDWVKMHNIPNDLSAFCRMILRGALEKQDVGIVHFFDKKGEAQHKYFANAGGLGYDSFVVQSVEQDTNRIFPKKFAYFIHIIKCLFAYKAERVRVVFDGQTVEDQFYTLHFGINKYAGAGMQLTPHAVKDDGLLALTLIREMPRWKVLFYTARLYSGAVAKIPEASLFKASRVKFESLGNPIFCETDGEFMGQAPAEISILETKLNVVVPSF
jgi:diacylglycerol kinase (ATP)